MAENPNRRLDRLRNPAPDVATTRAMRFTGAGGAVPGPSFASSPGLPPQGQQSSRAPFSRQIPSPRIEKLPSSKDFSVEDYAMALAAGVGSLVTSANLNFQLPTDSVGWLQEFRLFVLSQTALTSARWTVRINGGPVSGFTARQNIPGVANLLVIVSNDLRVRLPMGCTVDVLITNLNANGPWTVGGHLSGWYHPQIDELRVWGEDV